MIWSCEGIHSMARIVFLLLVVASFAPHATPQPLDEGKKQFEARCVGCHGSDGAGGAHGPSFLDVRRPRATSKEALRELIRKGIPDAGMPPAPMSDAEADAIIAYVELLKAPAIEHPASGDAVAGERFFTAKGKCATCHMVRGRGGILGPDLSSLGREGKLAQIEQALQDPGATSAPAFGGAGAPRGGGEPASYKAVTVRLRDGRTLRGLAKYESPFDLGLQSLDGTFHSISKSQ